METTDAATSKHPEPEHYEVRLSGQIDQRWTAWFGDLTIRPGVEGTTVITGPIADQAALHGLLQKVRDLGMPLISVVRCNDRPTHRPSTPDGSVHDTEENP